MRTFALPAVLLAALLAAPLRVAANVITVNTTVILVGGGHSPNCDLKEAILSANATNGIGVGGCGPGEPGGGPDVIEFDVEGTIEVPEELPTVEDDLTIEGPGADELVLDAELGSRILTVGSGASLTLEGLTLTRGAVPAGNGGALLLSPDSVTTLRDCRITASQAANGGAIYANQATLRVERCLIDGNDVSAQGGGVHARGATVELVNTTVSGNTASEGGGIAVVDAGGASGTTSLHSVTLAENEADEGANLLVAGASTAEARHTLFALPNGGDNCAGAVTSLDHNLADDASCGLLGANDQEATPAGLGALADNGGPTATHALAPGSAAIDRGDSFCRDAQDELLDTDQRGPGFPRRLDGEGPGFRCDVGAFEAVPEPAAGAAAALVALAALARRRPLRVPSPARRAPRP